MENKRQELDWRRCIHHLDPESQNWFARNNERNRWVATNLLQRYPDRRVRLHSSKAVFNATVEGKKVLFVTSSDIDLFNIRFHKAVDTGKEFETWVCSRTEIKLPEGTEAFVLPPPRSGWDTKKITIDYSFKDVRNYVEGHGKLHVQNLDNIKGVRYCCTGPLRPWMDKLISTPDRIPYDMVYRIKRVATIFGIPDYFATLDNDLPQRQRPSFNAFEFVYTGSAIPSGVKRELLLSDYVRLAKAKKNMNLAQIRRLNRLKNTYSLVFD